MRGPLSRSGAEANHRFTFAPERGLITHTSGSVPTIGERDKLRRTKNVIPLGNVRLLQYRSCTRVLPTITSNKSQS